MKKIIYLLFLSILVNGCATFGEMEEGLDALKGKEPRVAFDVLGYPSGKQQFGSDTVYFWTVNESGVVLLPQTSDVYATVGNKPVYGTVTSTQAVPVHHNCHIKLIADPSDRITKWEYEGNMGGCERYIRRLKAHMHDKK